MTTNIGLQQRLCDKSHMVVGAKVCDLTEDLLWFVCGLYVGILTSSLMQTISVIFFLISYLNNVLSP